jgi:hypothetical protein
MLTSFIFLSDKTSVCEIIHQCHYHHSECKLQSVSTAHYSAAYQPVITRQTTTALRKASEVKSYLNFLLQVAANFGFNFATSFKITPRHNIIIIYINFVYMGLTSFAAT